MEKPQQAKYANKACEYVFADGRHEIRQEGSLTWRLNNPGALRPPLDPHTGQPAPKKTKGYIGFATVATSTGKAGQFFIFPDYETGREAIRGNLQRLHSQKCIPEMVKAYAPSNENDPTKYADDLLAWTNIPRNRKLCEMSRDEFEKLINAIIRKEGWKEGQRKVVNTTSVSFTDGACPQQGIECKASMNGTEKRYLSNQFGKIPPIPHIGSGVIQIFFKNIYNEWKEIANISPGDPSKNLLVTIKDRIFNAQTDIHAHPAEVPKQPQPFRYVVQPGDTLGKIARKFNTSAAKIQQDNKIKNATKIYPSEVIWIFGTSPAEKDGTQNNTQSETKPQGQEQRAAAEDATDTTRSREDRGSPLATLPANPKRAPWMVVALKEAQDFSGKYEEYITTIHNYHASIRDGYKKLTGDDNPWCAAFVNWCLDQVKPPYPLSREKASSQSFMRDKNFKKIDTPVFGAIVVFSSSKDLELKKRNAKQHIRGHVGFVFSKGVVLGGNQTDGINFRSFSGMSKDYIVSGFYVPVAYYDYAQQEIKNGPQLASWTANELNNHYGTINKRRKRNSTR